MSIASRSPCSLLLVSAILTGLCFSPDDAIADASASVGACRDSDDPGFRRFIDATDDGASASVDLSTNASSAQAQSSRSPGSFSGSISGSSSEMTDFFGNRCGPFANSTASAGFSDTLTLTRAGADETTITSIPFVYTSNHAIQQGYTPPSDALARRVRLSSFASIDSNRLGFGFSFNETYFVDTVSDVFVNDTFDFIGTTATIEVSIGSDANGGVPTFVESGSYSAAFQGSIALGDLPPGVTCVSESQAFPGCDASVSAPLDLSVVGLDVISFEAFFAEREISFDVEAGPALLLVDALLTGPFSGTSVPLEALYRLNGLHDEDIILSNESVNVQMGATVTNEIDIEIPPAPVIGFGSDVEATLIFFDGSPCIGAATVHPIITTTINPRRNPPEFTYSNNSETITVSQPAPLGGDRCPRTSVDRPSAGNPPSDPLLADVCGEFAAQSGLVSSLIKAAKPAASLGTLKPGRGAARGFLVKEAGGAR